MTNLVTNARQAKRRGWCPAQGSRTVTMHERWEIRLLGGLSFRRGEYLVDRFRSHKTGLLLARLAHGARRFSREELADQIWPDADSEIGRGYLRMAAGALRGGLEPAGTPLGTVLVADRTSLGLNFATVAVDVLEFERLIKLATAATDPAERLRLLLEAAEQYHGPLLPRYYEDWILWERDRLAQAYVDVLQQLSAASEAAGAPDAAIGYALRAVAVDPLVEEPHARVIRLYLAAGRELEARRQYEEMAAHLWQELEMRPSPAITALVGPLAPGRSRPPAPGGSKPSPVRPERKPAAIPAPAAAPPAALPPTLPLNQFIGRDQDLDRLDALLAEPGNRLITLTGPAGMGKTRLAGEYATRMTRTSNTRAWMVLLAETSRPELIMEEILRALRVPPAPGADPSTGVVATLSGGPAMLILDNFEQLVEGGAVLISGLLEDLPELRCIVTSRRALDIAAEQEYRVAPLAVPTTAQDARRLHEFAAVQLFVERARRVTPEFHVTERNAPLIAAIVNRLEGHPLCLELAAGWVRTVTPAEMLRHLTHQLDFLVSRKRDVQPRHRALRAALHDSHNLLPPELQGFFARLSIFRGGWSAGAAAEVCEAPDALEKLDRLQSFSLVFARESGDEMRFTMLEIIREYAAEQLAGEERERLDRRHAMYYGGIAAEGKEGLLGASQVEWMRRLEDERENFRAALKWSVAAEPALALRLVCSLCLFWHLRGALREGQEWITRSLDAGSEEAPALRAKALNAAGILALARGELDMSRDYCEQSLAIQRDGGDRGGMASALCTLAGVALRKGELDRAQSALEESLELYTSIGDIPNMDAVTLNLGVVAFERGDLPRARSLLEQSATVARRKGDLWAAAIATHNLGETLRGMRALTEAQRNYEESIKLWLSLGDRNELGRTVRGLGVLAAAQGEWQRAASLLGIADVVVENAGAGLSRTDREELDDALAAVRSALTPSQFQEAWNSGRLLDLEHALAEILPDDP